MGDLRGPSLPPSFGLRETPLLHLTSDCSASEEDGPPPLMNGASVFLRLRRFPSPGTFVPPVSPVRHLRGVCWSSRCCATRSCLPLTIGPLLRLPSDVFRRRSSTGYPCPAFGVTFPQHSCPSPAILMPSATWIFVADRVELASSPLQALHQPSFDGLFLSCCWFFAGFLHAPAPSSLDLQRRSSSPAPGPLQLLPELARVNSDAPPSQPGCASVNSALGFPAAPITRIRPGSNSTPTRFRPAPDPVPTRPRPGSDPVPTRYPPFPIPAPSFSHSHSHFPFHPLVPIPAPAHSHSDLCSHSSPFSHSAGAIRPLLTVCASCLPILVFVGHSLTRLCRAIPYSGSAVCIGTRLACIWLVLLFCFWRFLLLVCRFLASCCQDCCPFDLVHAIAMAFDAEFAADPCMPFVVGLRASLASCGPSFFCFVLVFRIRRPVFR